LLISSLHGKGASKNENMMAYISQEKWNSSENFCILSRIIDQKDNLFFARKVKIILRVWHISKARFAVGVKSSQRDNNAQ